MACLSCGGSEASLLVDCGPQPISNRFLADAAAEEYRHPLSLGQCRGCGLVRLIERPPAEELRPRFDWITYNEPEGHLDATADVLAGLPGLGEDSVFCGVSFKDDTTLRRLRERGFEKTWRIDIASDLGCAAPGAGVETIQDKLTPEKADELADRRGKADVVLVRHILEHAYDMDAFLEALRRLGKPGAYYFFEVPDCEKSLERLDYCMIWEEHLAYFTPRTYKSLLAEKGFETVHYECVPYPMENSLVAVVRKGDGRTARDAASSARDLALGEAYAAGFPARREAFFSFLDARSREAEVAMFGAGHLACGFINYFGLRDKIAFIADDHPKKKGMFLPGSKTPILGSEALASRKVGLCLLGLNPNSEEKVIAANKAFIEKGGAFQSIFPASPNALEL